MVKQNQKGECGVNECRHSVSTFSFICFAFNCNNLEVLRITTINQLYFHTILTSSLIYQLCISRITLWNEQQNRLCCVSGIFFWKRILLKGRNREGEKEGGREEVRERGQKKKRVRKSEELINWLTNLENNCIILSSLKLTSPIQVSYRRWRGNDLNIKCHW